jgi:hypothetical protein
MMASDKIDGTKCLKKMIGDHCLDVQSRKSIWSLMIGSSSFAFVMQHGELSCKKNYECKKEFSDIKNRK